MITHFNTYSGANHPTSILQGVINHGDDVQSVGRKQGDKAT